MLYGSPSGAGEPALPRRFTHLTLPACLWWPQVRDLSAEAKLILAEIDQLCTKRREGRPWKWAWADNPHFAALINREERTVRRVLEELKERGLILVEFEADSSRPNNQRRWLAINGRDISLAVAGQTGPPCPVSSDRRPAPDRRSELTAANAHSLESEKDPCIEKQQQAAFHEEPEAHSLAAGRKGGGLGEAPFEVQLAWSDAALAADAARRAALSRAPAPPPLVCQGREAACGAAGAAAPPAAALSHKENGDGDADRGMAPIKSALGVVPQGAPESALTDEQARLKQRVLSEVEDVSTETAAGVVRRHDPDLVAEALTALAKKPHDNPMGWLLVRLRERQKERDLARAEAARRPPPPAPPPKPRAAVPESSPEERAAREAAEEERALAVLKAVNPSMYTERMNRLGRAIEGAPAP